MEVQKNDFLTPEERASLKEDVVDKVINKKILEDGIRPTIITVLCGYYFVSWFVGVINAIRIFSSLGFAGTTFTFSPVAIDLQGGIATLFAILFSVLFVAGIFGYWFMKRWGVYCYIASVLFSVILSLIVSNVSGFSFILSLILPGFMIYIGLKYLNRMFN